MTAGARDRAAGIAFDTDPDCILVTEGPAHTVIAANPAAQRLVPSAASIGRSLRSLLAADAPGLTTLCDLVLRTGAEQHEPVCRLDSDVAPGSSTFYDVVARPWGVTGNSTAGVVVHARAVGSTHPALSVERRFPLAREASLPRDLPLVPGLDVSALCLLGDTPSRSGEWLDVVVRTDGAVALVVGSVSAKGGLGPAAAGQLRAVVRDHLAAEGSLPEVVTGADRFARGDDELRAATLCVVEVDPVRGSMSWCTAGERSPLLLSHDGSTAVLPPTGGRPLTVAEDYPEQVRPLAQDDLVLLYSGGALHPAGREDPDAEAALARRVGEAVHGPVAADDPLRAVDRACRLTAASLAANGALARDVVLVAAQLVPTITPLSIDLTAEPAALMSVRDRMRQWLDAVNVGPTDVLVVQQVVGELVSNAIEHAYAEAAEPGAVRVDAVVEGHRLHVRVGDDGRWREAPEAGQARVGRGLSMVAGLTESLSVSPTAQGTEVVADVSVGGPVELVTPGRPSRDRSEGSVTVEGDVVVVRGPLSGAAATLLWHRVRELSQGGTRGVDVLLHDATLLDTAAVQVLYDVTAPRWRGVVLHARAGTVAHHALDVAGLPHLTG